VIDPELYHQLWKQEHGERLRIAARWQAVHEAQLTRVAGRFREVKGSISTHRNWMTLPSDGALRLRRLWTTSRPTQQSVGELNPCQSDS
jgi:hypothetical protein